MKRGSTLFLQIVICLLGLGVAAALIRFPLTEGRAAHLDLIHIYADPFIVYIYLGSLPFFIGLYQAVKLLNLIEAKKAFSQSAINTLKNMKLVSLVQIGFIGLALFYLRFFAHGDDPAGPTMLGFIVSLVFAAIATTLALAQKILQNAIDLKSENDLTI